MVRKRFCCCDNSTRELLWHSEHKERLPSVVTAKPGGSSFTTNFFHDLVPHLFLNASWVSVANPPALTPTHLAELLVVVMACTQQSLVDVEITCDVEAFGPWSTSFMHNLRHLCHKLVLLLQVLGRVRRVNGHDEQKSTVAHLTSDLHDFCTLQQRSDTSVVNLLPVRNPNQANSKFSKSHQRVSCNAKNHKQVSAQKVRTQ